MIRKGMLTVFLTAILLAAPRAALACPVCFGQSDSPLARATNLGILAMLGVVAVMLGSFAAFFVYLNKRARMFSADGSPAPVNDVRAPAANSQEGIARC